MSVRPGTEDGFGVIELLIALIVLTVALLALAAGYETAATSLQLAGKKSVASKLADKQVELYRSIPYSSIGLDATTTTNVGDSSNGAYDSIYTTNSLLAGTFYTNPVTGVLSQNASGTVNDVSYSGCGATPQCLPIQTITGSDGRSYRIETFIRDTSGTAGIRWSERVVTVVILDAAVTGKPEILRETAVFDRGP
jgi:Tfp pilus assembly protein PilV